MQNKAREKRSDDDLKKELKSLDDRIQVADLQKKNLRFEVEKLSSLTKQLLFKKNEYLKKLLSLDKANDFYKSEILTLKEKIKLTENEILANENDLKSLQLDLAINEKEAQRLKTEYEYKVSLIQGLRSQHEKSYSLYQRAVNMKQTAKNDLEQIENEKKIKVQEINQFEQDVNKIKEEIPKTKSEIDIHSKQLLRLQKSLEIAKISWGKASSELKNKIDTKESIKNKLENSQKVLLDTKAQVEKVQSKIKLEEQSLELVFAEQKQKVSDLKRVNLEKEKAINTLKTIENTKNQLSKKNDELDKSIFKLTEEKSRVLFNIDNAKKEILKINSNMAKINQGKEDLTFAIKGIMRKRDGLLNLKEQRKNILLKIESNIDQLETRYSEVNAFLERLTKEKNAQNAQITLLEGKREELKKVLLAKEKQIPLLENAIPETLKRIEELQTNIRSIQNELNSKDQELMKLNEQVEDKAHLVQKLNLKLKNCYEQNNIKDNQINEMLSKSSRLDERLKEIKNDGYQKTYQIDVAKKTIEQKRIDLARLVKKVELEEQNFEKLSAFESRLSSEVKRLNDEDRLQVIKLEKLQTKCYQLKSQIDGLNRAKVRALDNLEKSFVNIEDFEVSLKQLNNKREELKIEVNTMRSNL